MDSPAHGFNFCCGTASEGLVDPASELCPIVQCVLHDSYQPATQKATSAPSALASVQTAFWTTRYFAERKKIFHVHFRNIRGGLHDFGP